MTNFELELTNALGKSPIEEYIKQLQKDADAGFQSYQLKATPTEIPSSPIITIIDGEQDFLTELRRTQERDFLKYSLTVSQNGGLLMSSTEWTIPSISSSPLHRLYCTLSDILAKQEAKNHLADTIPTDAPGEEAPESLLIDAFVQALIADAKSSTPVILWEPSEPEAEDEYIARGFGTSQCSIRLTKKRLDETGSTFALRYEGLDGTEVFSSVESCIASETSELGTLYRLINTKEIQSDVNDAMKDAQCFVNHAKCAAIFDQIVAGGFPSICQPNPVTGENMVLVHDVFVEANMNVAVRCFLDEIRKRNPNLPPSRMLQLQTQAECIGKIIRHTARNPSSAVFASDALPSTICNGTAWKGKKVTAANNLASISNAWVPHLDILSSGKQVPVQRTMTKYVAILLAIIMTDYLS
jgi:hypothetical protein